jgi:transposase
MSKLTLGIDVSKKTLDVALLLLNTKWKHKKFHNNQQGFREFLTWLERWAPQESIHVCMEATGQYYLQCAEWLHAHGLAVSVVNPAQINYFAQAQLTRTKTDKKDAKVIALFCQAMTPELWTPDPKEIKELKSLVHALDQLKQLERQELNRLEPCQLAEVNTVVLESHQKIIEVIQTRKKIIEQEIKCLIQQHEHLKKKQELLESIPGVGEVLSSSVLACLQVGRFENARQCVAFVGLNPKEKQSGTSVRGRSRLSKTGSSFLRKVLYFPAITAKRFNPTLQVFCERLAQAGKHAKVIIGAAMRKLLQLIYGVLKSGKPYDPNFALTQG